MSDFWRSFGTFSAGIFIGIASLLIVWRVVRQVIVRRRIRLLLKMWNLVMLQRAHLDEVTRSSEVANAELDEAKVFHLQLQELQEEAHTIRDRYSQGEISKTEILAYIETHEARWRETEARYKERMAASKRAGERADKAIADHDEVQRELARNGELLRRIDRIGNYLMIISNSDRVSDDLFTYPEVA